jgi:hypothetical protein
MDSWEGSFSWQGYALEGRPDLLNYVQRGDVAWERVWDLYRSQPVDPAVVLRISGLFHAFMSSQYDREGCYLDEDGETCRQLRAWCRFAAEREDLLPEVRIQDALGRLGDGSLISRLYYVAAYQLYMEALLDRYADAWRDGSARASAPAAAERFSPSSAAAADAGPWLPGCYPPPERFADLRADPAWEPDLHAFLTGHQRSWNCAYGSTYSLADEEEALAEIGGEG